MRDVLGQIINSMVTKGDMSIGASRPPVKPTNGGPPSYDCVEAFRVLEETRSEWRELFAQAATSPYQSFEFLSAWSETLGKTQGLEPMIVLARDAERRALALLPFGVKARGPLRIATFLGGRESNFNLGLFRRGAEPDRDTALRLLKQAARAIPTPPDLYDLRNQPSDFEGAANPLLLDSSQPSPSSAYGATLTSDASALDLRLSKDARKKLRKKEARLAELGEIRYEHQASGAGAIAIIEALIAQKSERLAAANIGSNLRDEPFRAFLTLLATQEGEGALELHALTLSGKIIATYAGLAHDGRFSAMLNSFDMSDEIARCSPGDLLLHALLRNLVSRGFARFDLGIGEARYKNTVCTEKIELFDTIVPVTVKGAFAAPMFSIALRIKRKIKQSPSLARAITKARHLARF
jgi:CelD/BcsL family acetyltransferase involved in cellulose biosynthesis